MRMDVHWSLGFIAGAACAGVLMKALALGLPGLLQLVIVICAGVGGGWMADALLKKKQ